MHVAIFALTSGGTPKFKRTVRNCYMPTVLATGSLFMYYLYIYLSKPSMPCVNFVCIYKLPGFFPVNTLTYICHGPKVCLK